MPVEDFDVMVAPLCGIIGGRDVGVAPTVDLMVASVIARRNPAYQSGAPVVMRAQLDDGTVPTWNLLPKRRSSTLAWAIQADGWGNCEWKRPQRAFSSSYINLGRRLQRLPIVAIGNDGPGQMRAPTWYPETLSVETG
ncbi:MAG: hypothetical protein R2867_09605 [Caldilineaceae bacterium]